MKTNRFVALAKNYCKEFAAIESKYSADLAALTARYNKAKAAIDIDIEATWFVSDWVQRHMKLELWNGNYQGGGVNFTERGAAVRLETTFFDYESVTIPYEVFSSPTDRKVFLAAFKRGLIR